VAEPKTWTIRHFSQANKPGPGQGSVSALLRTVADTIDTIDSIEVQDIVMHTEVTGDDEYWVSMTVYFHLPGDE